MIQRASTTRLQAEKETEQERQKERQSERPIPARGTETDRERNMETGRHGDRETERAIERDRPIQTGTGRQRTPASMPQRQRNRDRERDTCIHAAVPSSSSATTLRFEQALQTHLPPPPAREKRSRSHRRFRNRDTEFLSESVTKWMNGCTQRHCDRTLGGGRAHRPQKRQWWRRRRLVKRCRHVGTSHAATWHGPRAFSLRLRASLCHLRTLSRQPLQATATRV